MGGQKKPHQLPHRWGLRDAMPALPEVIKAGILAMVKAAGDGVEG